MYEVALINEAEGFLRKLNNPQQIRIRDKLRELRRNPRLGEQLAGRLAGLRSLRVDQYRSIYTIKDLELIVLVLKIGHRKDAYFKRT